MVGSTLAWGFFTTLIGLGSGLGAYFVTKLGLDEAASCTEFAEGVCQPTNVLGVALTPSNIEFMSWIVAIVLACVSALIGAAIDAHGKRK